MKRLAIVVLGGGLAWSAYWFVAASGEKSALNSWFAARNAEGWSAEVSDIGVRGYPYRLDATLSNIALGDPDTGLAWEAEFFQILALSYRPNHVIAVWPKTQLLATPYDKYDISTTKMRASLVLGTETSLPLSRAVLVADAMEISARSGGTTRMNALHLAVQQLLPAENTYKFALSANGLAPSAPWRQQIDPGNLLPDRFTALALDMTASFTAPWDIYALERARPQPVTLTLKRAKMHWGELEILAAGALDIGPQGDATGRISLKVRNWRDILRLSVAAGAMPQGLADTLETGLGLVSQLAGNPKSLDLTLEFDKGQMWLGPIPLGQGPRFTLR